MLVLHSTAERYGSDKSLLLLASALVVRGWDVLVGVPQTGPLCADLDAAGVAWTVVDPGVVRRVLRPMGWARFVGRLPLSIVRVRRLARFVVLIGLNHHHVSHCFVSFNIELRSRAPDDLDRI